MPRDSQGNYSLPPVYLAVTGQTVLAEQHNTPLTDIAASITGSLPRNGTGSMLANLPMGSNRITNLASGTALTDAATLAQAQSSGVPIGTVLDFAGAQPPTGFLLCYGQAISRAEYADLFGAIGTTYGAGNGSTTFNLPDARGRVVAGIDVMGGSAAGRLNTATMTSSGLGGTGGTQTINLSISQLPAHNHGGLTGAAGAHDHTYVQLASFRETQNIGPTANDTWNGVGSNSTSTALDHQHVIASQGSGADVRIVQPTIGMNKIIKAFTP